MARKILVLWAGRHLRDDWDALCGRYRERIGRTLEVEERPVRVRPGSGRERLVAEGRALLAALPDPCWTVALDRRGRSRSSRSFTRWMGEIRERWPHPVAFLIGSDLGLDRAVTEAARERLSLGPMTLPHELARLLLYEQIYRGLCIEGGIKYHRGPL